MDKEPNNHLTPSSSSKSDNVYYCGVCNEDT